jgi:hypothetical protein
MDRRRSSGIQNRLLNQPTDDEGVVSDISLQFSSIDRTGAKSLKGK